MKIFPTRIGIYKIYHTFLSFFAGDLINQLGSSILKFLSECRILDLEDKEVLSVCEINTTIDILSVAVSDSLTLGSKIAEKKNTTVSVYLLVRKESFV